MKIKEFLVNEECTMLGAMELLDKLAKKVLFVSENNRLVAAITDGDIRRWILKKGNLDAKVKEIANYQPLYLFEKDKASAKEFMMKHSIEALPIVDEDMFITAVLFWNNKEINNREKLNIPVVIMAGGFGKRLYPYTKILPKPLIPIGEIPIVEHIINRFKRSGCENFFLIVNHKKNMIKAYFNEIKKDYSITYINEDKPLGTGGGLSLLKGKIKSTFILSNCDILIDEDYEKIFRFHQGEKNLITMICSMKRIRIPYGVVEINTLGEIEEMREKPEISVFVNTGMYIVDGSIINELEENVEISFPDIIENYRRQGKKIGIFPISEKAWLDMGQLDELEIMRKRLEDDE